MLKFKKNNQILTVAKKMKILFSHENVLCDLSNERKLCQEFNYAIRKENKLTISQKFFKNQLKTAKIGQN